MTRCGAVLGGVTALVLATVLAGSCGRTPRPPQNPAAPTPPAPTPDGTPRVVVSPGVRFQTISGWEAVAQAGHDDSPAFLAYRDQLYDRVVDELGIDRLRVEVRSGSESTRDAYGDFLAGRLTEDQWRPFRYATVNDNSDPFSLNMGGFFFTELDNTIEKVVLPIKQRLEARGRRLWINVNYVAFTQQIQPGGQYHHSNPEEYAEFVQAVYRHLSERYGLLPDSWEMVLEPDTTPHHPPAFLRQAMVAAGNRLAAMGITPRFVAPSTANMTRAIDYADTIAQGGLPRFWTELSYHRYADVSDQSLRALSARATQYGVATAMLEHIGSGYEDLHDDLKTGGNTAWQQFVLAYPGVGDDGSVYYVVDTGNAASPGIAAGSRTSFLAQYFRYVRRGAVRIDATTSDGAFNPVAFTNPDGRTVVVVKADREGAFAIEGLAAGNYEVTSTTASAARQRLGDVTVTAGSLLRVTAPGRGVVTIAGN